MKTIQNKRLLLYLVIGSFLLALSTLYLCRNQLLQMVVSKKISTIQRTYHLDIAYQTLKMKGLHSLSMEAFTIVPQHKDTLVQLKSLDLEIDLWSIFKGDLKIDQVNLSHLRCTFIKRGDSSNYDFLFINPQEKNRSTSQVDYARKIKNSLGIIFNLLPKNGSLKEISITQQKDNRSTSIYIHQFDILQSHFNGLIEIKEDSLTQHLKVNGELDKGDKRLQVKLYGLDQTKVNLPYITRRFEANIAFDTLSYDLNLKPGIDAHSITLKGKAAICGLTIFHKSLSPDPICLDRGQLDYHLNINRNTLELDSTSTVLFNKLQFHPYLRAEKKQHWHLTASTHKEWFPSDHLFSSLPKGLFTNLEGLKTSGELSYQFFTDIDFSQLDSLKFQSDLKSRQFKIQKFGATNLRKMSEEFLYTAYENGRPLRSFLIGPSYEHFTPLDSISPLLQMAVLQSEDGGFLYHRGFLPDAIQEALIYDLKVKKFARGGSTISMQLVKNVFLNKNKNFMRKLEEALLVWLIENQHLTSKERMYEVYLNIAEWAPMVYGVQEAAHFYFNKRPSELNTEESIFLASIIPKPKHFRNSFQMDGNLKANLEGYYRLIAKRLAKKGLIDEVTADSIKPDIKLSGESLHVIMNRETPETKPSILKNSEEK